MLGVFRALPGGGGRLVPVEKRAQGREIVVAAGDEGGARGRRPRRRDALQAGPLRPAAGQGAGAARLAEVREGGEPRRDPRPLHPARVLPRGPGRGRGGGAREPRPAARTGATCPSSPSTRRTPRTTTTPSTPRPTTIRTTPAATSITVAIADVAAYVRPGSALDREALERGNSVYFPDRVVPMLPERISNDLCSLRPREARPALAVRMVVGPDGRKKRHSFHRVTMRSAAKLAYAQAQAAIDGRPDDATGPLLDPVLKPLWAAYACVKAARDRREPLALDLPERKILLKPDGTVDRVLVARAPRRAPADRGVHDPRQRRRGRDAGEGPLRPDLPRPRRALAGEDARARRGAGLDRHQAAEAGGAEAGAVQPHPAQPSRARSTRSSSTRSCCARRRRPSTPPRTTGISGSTCAATPISPRRSAATPTSSCTAP